MSYVRDENGIDARQCDENGEPICDEDEPLLTLCDEMVTLLETLNSEDGPVNQAEAAALPPEKMQRACELQHECVQRVFCLTEVIPKRRAQTETELAAKRRAIQVLSMEQTWDIRSLRTFRESIDVDVIHLAKLPVRTPAPARRSSWLSRLGSFFG
jgi:hypothetical protein